MAKLDTAKLVACGHSFGGITSLMTQMEDPRVKGAIGLDPWFFPVYKELNSGRVGIQDPSQSTCMLVTQFFPTEYEEMYRDFKDYNRKAQFAKFLQNSKNVGRQRHVTMLSQCHQNQTDLMYLQPIELYLLESKVMPKVNYATFYRLNMWSAIEFLYS